MRATSMRLRSLVLGLAGGVWLTVLGVVAALSASSPLSASAGESPFFAGFSRRGTSRLLATAGRSSAAHASIAKAAARDQLQRLPDSDAEPGRYAAQLAAVQGVQGGDAQANIPGVWDAHRALDEYVWSLLKYVRTDLGAVRAAQQRTTAAQLGISVLDPMDELSTIPQRIQFINRLAAEERPRMTQVAMATTALQDVRGLRRELLPWIAYHLHLGIAHFYILYDGDDHQVVAALRRLSCVTLLFVRQPFASAKEIQDFDAWNRRHWQWGGQPGNFELMVKQGFGVERALAAGMERGMDWLLQMDPDELLYPQSEAFDITVVLARQPDHVPAVRFLNFEGQPEAVDLLNRFEQVTLFRVHQHYVTPEAYRHRSGLKLGDNKTFLVLYANGKSAVRVMAGVSQLGPHFFRGPPSPRWVSESNPSGEWRTAISEDTLVLHYAYSYLSDVSAKSARSCPASYVAAAKAGDLGKVKECFVLEFDQEAFLAAAKGNATETEDFFLSRNVLTEGSRIRCRDQYGALGWCLLTNIEHYKRMLTRIGLLRRIHEPSVILKSQERAIQQSIAEHAAV